MNARSVTNVEQGLRDAGFEIGTTAWLDRFDQDCTDCGKKYMTRFQAVLTEKGAAGAFWALDNPYRDPDVPAITPGIWKEPTGGAPSMWWPAPAARAPTASRPPATTS